MRVKRLCFAVPIAVAALFASTGIARADQVWLVDQTVTVPGSPVTETAQVVCSSSSPGTETITLWLNGSPEVGVTIPFPNLGPATFTCTSQPVTVGWTGGPYTLQAYINRPNGPVCALTVGGACILDYPFNPMTDTLVVTLCTPTSCNPLGAFSLSITGIQEPLPTISIQ